MIHVRSSKYRLDSADLAPTTKKPFDVLVEGPYFSKSRGDRI
jgi:hypothetical protein